MIVIHQQGQQLYEVGTFEELGAEADRQRCEFTLQGLPEGWLVEAERCREQPFLHFDLLFLKGVRLPLHLLLHPLHEDAVVLQRHLVGDPNP